MFKTTSLLSRSVKSAKFFTASAAAAQGPVIGFIGLGNMGHGMVKNILLAPANIQSKVIVYDIDQEKLRSTVVLGAVEASNVKSLAQQSDVIISILPTSQCVLSVLGGADGVFANAKPGSMIIESSTIDPLTADALHKSALDHKLRMLDSPVSGGRVGAEAGTLTFIVGGSEENFESARGLMSAMGKNLVHCGEAGAGARVKLCNNLALGISMIGTCEAMDLGVQMGLNPAKLAAVMNTSTGRSWSSEVNNPVPGVLPNSPATKGHTAFAVELMEKDLRYAMDIAHHLKCRTPLGNQAHQLYGILNDKGYGQRDFSIMYEFLRKQKPTKSQ